MMKILLIRLITHLADAEICVNLDNSIISLKENSDKHLVGEAHVKKSPFPFE